jgi:Protein of unknown function (DUF2934)
MRSTSTDTAREYRKAFEEYSQKARKFQLLTAQQNPDKAAIVAALVELEKVRVAYNRRRDELAKQLLTHALPEPDFSQAHAARIKQVAELLWEFSGKPEGTADDDWHRAEEIIRRTAAA